MVEERREPLLTVAKFRPIAPLVDHCYPLPWVA
jgi:hypothetical protein